MPGGSTAHRWFSSGTRLGVRRGEKTRSSGVRLRAVGNAGRGDGQEVAIHHVEKIARGEAVGGREDVGLAPTDELLAGLAR